MEYNFIGDDFGPLFHYQFRVILIGDSSVGKSSLLRYFTEGKIAEISDPTVGVDFYACMIESITRSYYRNSVGVMLVYDISNRASFENINGWLHEAEANMGGPNPSKCVFLLIGHKSDNQCERRVDYEEGEYFAKYHKMKFIETSAITGKNVYDAFLMMAQEIYKRVEEGSLRPTDGWEGVKGGLMRSQSICLSETDLTPRDHSSCSC
ncbi:unnamed protein product [Haemonchus placei]|uniref:Ras-related protein Rab-39B n=1 Tax=Haemonchus placei TaxID=6290 RepID=A0A0N4WHZ8_HAEPC|nr:unnamed protein product [Haemonchus placei]